MEAIKNNWRGIVVGILTASALFVWYVAFTEDRRGILTVTFLDVGQGDAILIDAPNGNQLLIDGGPPGKGVRALSRALPFYDHAVDLVALSHPHLDHFGGFLDIVRAYGVGAVITSGTVNGTPDFAEWQKLLREKELKELVLERGERINLGAGVYVDVLLPDRDVSGDSPHNGTLVLRLTYGTTSFLFTGDMEENLEQYLVSLEGEKLTSTVLKVGHHGSDTSTSKPLLGFVGPQYAVISVGEGNSYGHPKQETLDALSEFGVETLRTDERGDIVLMSNGETVFMR